MTDSSSASYDVDPWTLDLDERFDAMRAVRREIARLQARELRLVASIVDDPREGVPAPVLEKEYVREELRAALGESAMAVGVRIDTAHTLLRHLPATLAALEAGELGMRHARLLYEAVTGLPGLDADGAAELEKRCVPFAAGRDVSAFARKVRREVIALDDRTAEERMTDTIGQATANRRVWVQPDQYSPALAHLGAVLPAEGAQALMMALDVAADRTEPDDARSRDHRRADALVQFGLDALNSFEACPACRGQRLGSDAFVVSNDNDTPGSDLPRLKGLRPTIQVSVALSTLLGTDNQPAELDGHGPIPAALARRLADDPSGTWRRLVTDPLGKLIDYGRSVYKPPAALRDFVIARDRTCRFAGCNRPACRCEIDHVVSWEDGGLTNEPGLHALCCRHHHLKHDTDWSVERRPDGTTIWTSPTGDTYTVDPATYPTDTTIVVPDDNDVGDADAA